MGELGQAGVAGRETRAVVLGVVLAAGVGVSWGAGGALSPGEALAAFELESEDLEIELVAAEPDVIDPVAMAFDGNGRLYVVEGRGYPTTEGVGVVAVLEDGDGDGKFERVSEFAGGLRFPTGVLPWRDGLFVTDAPELLFVRDRDGDGVADEREVVLTGFGTARSTQLRVNDPTLGPDGWLYLSGGWGEGTAMSAVDPDGGGVDAKRSDVRFDPGTGALEPADGTCQYGMAFDRAGRRFVCMNRVQATHVVAPRGVFGRFPLLAVTGITHDLPDGGTLKHERMGNEPAATRLYPVSDNITTSDAHASSFSAACSVTVFESSGLPERYRGQVFSCDPTGNLVHRDELIPRGATFTARRSDDGRELVRSTDNWFRPVFLAEGPDGALYICDMYREVIEHPEYLPEAVRGRTSFDGGRDRGRIWRLRKRSRDPGPVPAGEIEMLAGGDRFTRELGQRRLLEGPSALARAAGELRALVRAGDAPGAAKVLAVGLLEKAGHLEASDLAAALRDGDPAVREAALWAADRLGVVDPSWFGGGGGGCDPDARVAFVGLLVGSPVLDAGARQRMAVEVARRHGMDDRWMRLAVAAAAVAAPDRVLAELGGAGEPVEGLDELARLLGEAVGRSGDGDLLERCRAGVLAGGGPGEGIEPWRLAFADGAEITGLPDSHMQAATGIAVDSGAPARERATAVRVVARQGGDLVDWLEGLVVAEDAPAEVARAAVAALAERSGDRLVDPAVWSRLSPELKSMALARLVSSGAHLGALLEAVEAGTVPAALFDASQRERLAAGDGRFAEVLENLGGGDRKAAFEALLPAAALAGDREVGARVFRERCASCHLLERIGQAVAPDLYGIRNQPKEAILLHVVVPNHEVMPASVNYVAETRDGRQVAGLLVGESDAAVTLRGPFRTDVVIPRGDLVSLDSTGRSMMPDGLEAGLEDEEVAGLLAFLKGE